MFELDSRLANDTLLVGDLPLCRVLLMNDCQFPWVILVPRIADVTEIIELNKHQRQQFWLESDAVSRVLKTLFSPDKLNVAALGNIVKQLHLHHIARFETDVAWPAPVWGRQATKAYDTEQANALCDRLRHALELTP